MANSQSIALEQDVISILKNKNLLKRTAIFYNRCLMEEEEDGETWKYLTSRGIRRGTAIRFLLGKTPEDPGDLVRFLLTEGYSRKEFRVLISEDEIPCFKYGRIVFPIFGNGSVMNLTSRSLPSVLTFAKHKNLRGKRWTFYDPRSVNSNEDLFIVEGPFDRLTLEQANLRAICFLGTNGFKDEYANIIRRIKTRTVYCIPDADDNPIARKANFKTYIKIHEACSPFVPRIRILDLPNNGDSKVDPNSYFCNRPDKEIREELQDLAAQAVPLYKTVEWNQHIEHKKSKQARIERKRNIEIETDSILNLPIVEVLALFGIGCKEEGDHYRCRCINPEHEDRNPSMAVYPKTNTFYCFSCNTSGDNIGVVSLIKGTNFVDSCALLKQEFSVGGNLNA